MLPQIAETFETMWSLETSRAEVLTLAESAKLIDNLFSFQKDDIERFIAVLPDFFLTDRGDLPQLAATLAPDFGLPRTASELIWDEIRRVVVRSTYIQLVTHLARLVATGHSPAHLLHSRLYYNAMTLIGDGLRDRPARAGTNHVENDIDALFQRLPQILVAEQVHIHDIVRRAIESGKAQLANSDFHDDNWSVVIIRWREGYSDDEIGGFLVAEVIAAIRIIDAEIGALVHWMMSQYKMNDPEHWRHMLAAFREERGLAGLSAAISAVPEEQLELLLGNEIAYEASSILPRLLLRYADQSPWNTQPLTTFVRSVFSVIGDRKLRHLDERASQRGE